MTAGLPAGSKLFEREQGEQQRPHETRGVVPVGDLEGFCFALGKRVIQACGARSEGFCLARGKRVIQTRGVRVARPRAAKERQRPSGGYCTRERTA